MYLDFVCVFFRLQRHVLGVHCGTWQTHVVLERITTEPVTTARWPNFLAVSVSRVVHKWRLGPGAKSKFQAKNARDLILYTAKNYIQELQVFWSMLRRFVSQHIAGYRKVGASYTYIQGFMSYDSVTTIMDAATTILYLPTFFLGWGTKKLYLHHIKKLGFVTIKCVHLQLLCSQLHAGRQIPIPCSRTL